MTLLRLTKMVAVWTALALVSVASAARVYVMSSSYNVQDDAIVSSLASAGHTPVIGVTFNLFDGTVDLTGYDAVFLQANYNWTSGDMPEGGQTQLIGYVQAGGGLVTSEWVIWLTATGVPDP